MPTKQNIVNSNRMLNAIKNTNNHSVVYYVVTSAYIRHNLLVWEQFGLPSA